MSIKNSLFAWKSKGAAEALQVLVRNHFIIVMIRWTGLAPWELELPFPGSLTSTFLERARAPPKPCRYEGEGTY